MRVWQPLRSHNPITWPGTPPSDIAMAAATAFWLLIMGTLDPPRSRTPIVSNQNAGAAALAIPQPYFFAQDAAFWLVIMGTLDPPRSHTPIVSNQNAAAAAIAIPPSNFQCDATWNPGGLGGLLGQKVGLWDGKGCHTRILVTNNGYIGPSQIPHTHC